MKKDEITEDTIKRERDETTCDYCGLALYVGNSVYNTANGKEFCSTYCVGQFDKTFGKNEA
jgi:hypothetical protein